MEKNSYQIWKDYKKQDLKSGGHVHLMGICGTAMASLAGLLKEMNYNVTGSDQNPYPPMSTQLEGLGIGIMQGYLKENLNIGTDKQPDLVIVGNVMMKKYEEVQALLETNIPYISLPQALGLFTIEDRNSFVIAGTHGKTTTTSMLSWVAESCGQSPGFLIGGIPKNLNRSFRVPKKNTFIIEGDEYDTAFFDKVPKFIHYKPKYVALTSIEFDHADIYNDISEVTSAFDRLVKLIPENGLLVANANNEIIQSLLPSCKAKVITYGLESDVIKADYQARVIGNNEVTEFEVVEMKTNSVVDKIVMQAFGEYNVLNALASYLIASNVGWDKEKTKEALHSFSGVKRRQEIIGCPNDIIIIEDFAHHPTAVGMTIDSVQKKYQGKKVFSIFEPRSATSRRKIFEKEYIEAFSKAQNLLLAKPFDQSRIPEDDRFDADHVIATINQQGVNAALLDGADVIVDHLKHNAKPNDVILIMSNGGFDGIYQKLLDGL